MLSISQKLDQMTRDEMLNRLTFKLFNEFFSGYSPHQTKIVIV